MQTKSVQALNGVISFTDVNLVGNPGSDAFIKIEANTIDKSKISKAFPNNKTLMSDFVV